MAVDMRVVIAKKLLSTVGGSEVQARALAMALRDRGHAVAVVGLRPAIPLSTHASSAAGSSSLDTPLRNSPRTSDAYASGSSCSSFLK